MDAWGDQVAELAVLIGGGLVTVTQVAILYHLSDIVGDAWPKH